MVVHPPVMEPARIGSGSDENVSGHAMWHVTVTLGGSPVVADEVRIGLEVLAHLHPFLLSGRYAADRAEVRYWDEGQNAAGVLEFALGLWSHHREAAGLPDWTVVGIEVVDQGTYRSRCRTGEVDAHVVGTAAVTPFPGPLPG